jgi:uncharacterized membrane protein
MDTEPHGRLQRWRDRAVSLEAVAATGVLFAVLFVASVGLMRAGLPDVSMTSEQIRQQYLDPDARRLVLVGYSLAPFSMIMFLWFVGVMRRRIPPTDRFIATVFTLASAVFVALFLVAASLVGGPFYLQPDDAELLFEPSTLLGLQSAAYGLVFVIGVRVQVLIVLTATAASRTHGALPRWLLVVGYIVAVIQTLNLALFEPLVFTFPAWVVAVSVTLLVRQRER